MAKYTFDDVIINPDDPRVEFGKEYYYADFPIRVLDYANSDIRTTGILKSISGVSPETPFEVYACEVTTSWACLIRKKELSYVERQSKWLADNNVKVGDKVRVVRKAQSREDGWGNAWVEDMDDWVGKVFKVDRIYSDDGIRLVDSHSWWVFPYFVLEKVELEYEPYDLSDLDLRASLLGKAVKFMDGSRLGPALITGFELFDDGVWGVHVGGVSTMDAIALLDGWVFLDGTPCGVVVEDVEERP